MKRLKIDPLFIGLFIFLLFSARFALLYAALLAVAFHEAAHYFIAKSLGYSLTRLNLKMYGAVLSADDFIPDKDMLYIAASGPACNFLIATFTVALWWIYPVMYGITLPFFRANLAIGAFNMLPVFPLDGGRIALSFAKNKKKRLKLLRFFGIFCGAAFAALFVLSAFFKINYTLAILSVTLVSGGLSSFKKEKYIMLCQQIYHLQDFSRPIQKTELYVHESMKIATLLREIKKGYYYVVHVVDNSMNVLRTIEGKELEEVFYMDRQAKLTTDN